MNSEYRPTMPKQSLKQTLKQSIAKLRPAKNANKTPAKKPQKANSKTKQASSKRFKFQKSISGSKKKMPEPEIPSVAKSLPKGIKIADKYPLYEPFSQVVIVQDPKTGEYKYVLDELQLDPLERGIYNRILEILLAEIDSPKEANKRSKKILRSRSQKNSRQIPHQPRLVT